MFARTGYTAWVNLDHEQCYRALRARDARFDGLFFVAVESTGIYCRTICPARTPAESRCRFYRHAAAAEHAGFRACLRCRPELAPGHARVDALPRLVRLASEQIAAGYLDEHGVDELASGLGVSARHLRRAMEAELGVSPLALARTRRLAMAKQLVQDTQLPMTQVAFASGFSSVRRFNASMRERFGVSPSNLRRGRSKSSVREAGLTLRLDYRPPLEWSALLSFLAARAMPGVEQVDDRSYRRSAEFAGRRGWIDVRADDRGPRLRATISPELAGRPLLVVRALRAMFDLDAEPARVSDWLAKDPQLAARVRRRPGLRVPGAFDRFETAVRVVLGQQISVRAATTFAARLVLRFGALVPEAPAGLDRLFPDAATLAVAPLEQLRAIGLTGSRAQTLSRLAKAVASGELSLEAEPEAVTAALLALPGVGPWTASMIAMRALGYPDAMPAGDLIVRRALGCERAREAEALSERWRPWRAYAVMHLWMDPS